MRPGYKQTEVGVIPDAWITQTIAQASRKIQDYRGRTPKKLGMDWGGGDIPSLSAGNVKMGFIDFDEECYLASESLYKRWMVNGDIEQGDIVFTMEAPLGNVALIPDNRKYVLSQRTVLLQPSSETIYSPFLYQVLMSHRFQRQLIENATGSTAQGIQRKKFEKLTVVCPPLAEQRAIATALSDVDALLAKLDQFIAKKRDLKQAAMQQLLTGQTRLPGFSGEWEVKRLGDVLHVRHVRSQHHIVVNDGQYPILATGGEIGRTNTFLYDKPSVLIGRKGTIDKPQYRDEPFWTVDTLFYTEILGGTSAKFNFYKFNMINWRGYNEASGVPSLNASTIENIEIKLPKPNEQTAIATVLSDMDAELAALEARRDKTRALKQGMMQELLTGRIRLV